MNQATAEILNHAESSAVAAAPDLRLVPNEPRRFLLLDSVPEIAQAAERAEVQARQTIDDNMQLLRDGRFDEVLPVIDALGTGKRVTEVQSSPERFLRHRALEEDCRRLFGEAKRKLRPELFPKTEQQYDQRTEDFYFGSLSIGDMIQRSLTAVAEKPQQEVRIIEAREHARSRAIGRMIMPREVEIQPVENEAHAITVSQCPDYVIDHFKDKPDSNKYAGYVPKIAKWVIRDLSFDRTNLRAFQEQAAISGEYITNEVINEAFQVMGLTRSGEHYSKSEIQDMQFGVEGAFDVLEFVELCDMLASQKTGLNIFLGEVVGADDPKDYTQFRAEAQQRYEATNEQAEELADYIMDLVERGVDSWAADKLVEDKVKQMLLDEVRQNPDLALEMFDEATWRGIHEVHALEARGDCKAAEARWAEVLKNAPTPGFCGAGSCGLESVASSSAEGRRAIALGLDAISPDELIHDTERACPSCSEFKVYYDKNGSKACTGCGKTEIKLGYSKSKETSDE